MPAVPRETSIMRLTLSDWPFNLEGAYVNFMMDDEVQGRVQATYGDNYVRLASIKAKYDAENLFRVNQNILPAGA
jgi:Berberine and berberine like